MAMRRCMRCPISGTPLWELSYHSNLYSHHGNYYLILTTVFYTIPGMVMRRCMQCPISGIPPWEFSYYCIIYSHHGNYYLILYSHHGNYYLILITVFYTIAGMGMRRCMQCPTSGIPLWELSLYSS